MMILETTLTPSFFTPAPAPQLDPNKQWFRGLHPAEGGRQPSQVLQSPEILPPYNPTVALVMTKSIQLMDYDLAAHFHPAIRADREKWKITRNHSYCMNNGVQNGFPSPKDENPVPHVDYVTEYPNVRDPLALPLRFDKMQRMFSGSVMSGHYGYSVMVAIRDTAQLLKRMVIAPRSLVGRFHQAFSLLTGNNIIWCEPGIDAIDARNFQYIPGTPEAAATFQNILDQFWFSKAVADGHGTPFRMGGHWGDGWIAYSFILDRPVSFESRFFVPWRETVPPEPLKIYNRV